MSCKDIRVCSIAGVVFLPGEVADAVDEATESNAVEGLTQGMSADISDGRR
jgi:hypothetical protein